MMGDIINQGYDYSQLAPALADQLQRRVGTIRHNAQLAGAAIIEIGRELAAAKEELPHGEWLPWLSQELGMEPRTAQNYIRVAETFTPDTPALKHLTAGALYALASPALPEPARQELLDRAEQGEPIGKRETREAKQRHTANTKRVSHLESDPASDPANTKRVSHLEPDPPEQAQPAPETEPHTSQLEQAQLKAKIAALEGENERLKTLLANSRSEYENAVALLAKRDTSERERVAQERVAQARANLERYKEQVGRAQQYKATSARGEAVAPLLNCISDVALALGIE